MTTGLRQLVDNRERMFEQIKLETHHPPSLLPLTPTSLSLSLSPPPSLPRWVPRLGMLQPLHHFLDHELEQVKTTQKTYHKAKADSLHVVEKLSQVCVCVCVCLYVCQEVVYYGKEDHFWPVLRACFGFAPEKSFDINKDTPNRSPRYNARYKHVLFSPTCSVRDMKLPE